MPFYTVLHFYRPTEPPRITGDSLAQFVAAFGRLNVAEDDGPLSVEVKFGESIDQDERPSILLEPINEMISTVTDIDWDVEVQCPSLRAVGDALAGDDRPVYRTFLQLGRATENVIRRLMSVNSPENNLDLKLTDWPMEIGPILTSDLGSEGQFLVGWVSLSLSGNGYLYPWTFSELVQRAEDQPEIRRATELCRATWPMPHVRPDRRHQRLRRKMGDLWPYAKVGRPWDGYWGLSESD